MEDLFKSYCSFGSKDSAPLMDNAKFAKLARETKILDKSLTASDVDIIFSKVKAATDRRISYRQFEQALQLLAEKKYGSPDVERLKNVILRTKGPKTSGGTRAINDGAVARLTDTSKYTGAHRERFDDSGKGKGLEGRFDYNHKAAAGYTDGYKGMGSYDKKH